jgi:hypothetical protein
LDLATLEEDAALLWVHDAADRFQDSSLASAISAKDCDNAALRHVEGYATDGHDRAVTGLDVTDF